MEYCIKPAPDVLSRGGFIFSSLTAKEIDNLSVEQIRINSQTHSIELDINAKNKLNETVQNEIISSILKKQIGYNSVKLNIKCVSQPQPQIKAEEYIENNWQNIIAEIRVNYPAAGGVFSAHKYNYDEQTRQLIIAIKSDLALKIITMQKIDIFIKQKIETSCGYSINVSFEKGDFSDALESFNREIENAVGAEIETIKKQTNGDTAIILGGEIKKKSNFKIADISVEENNAVIEGFVLNVDVHEYKTWDGGQQTQKTLTKFILTDLSSSIFCVYHGQRALKINNDEFVRVEGNIRFDKNSELCVNLKAVNRLEKEFRLDTAQSAKRIELHLHTTMSRMDALIDVKELMKTLKRWGHTACAVTDHGTAHIFPDFYDNCKKNNIKPILGMEGYMIDAVSNIFDNHRENIYDFSHSRIFIQLLCNDYCASEILGINFLKVDKNSKIIKKEFYFTDEFKLACYNDNNQSDKKKVIKDKENAAVKINEFIGDSIICGYDVHLQLKKLELDFNIKINNPAFDIRQIGLLKIKDKYELKIKTPLAALFEDYKIEEEAVIFPELETLKKIFDLIIDEYSKDGLKTFNEFSRYHQTNEQIMKTTGANHIVLLVKNREGLVNLYRLISLAHLQFSYRTPKLPRAEIIKFKKGLMFGSACEAGDVFQGILYNAEDTKIIENSRFYDYIELQPIENNKFFIDEKDIEIKNEDEIRQLNKRLYSICKKYGKTVVATSDAHFIEPEQSAFRLAIQHSIGMKDKRDATNLCLKTTNEMLEEFAYLGDEAAAEIVITAPAKIIESIEDVKPVPDGFYPPQIENADNILKEIVMKKAADIYGEHLPEIVQQRLDKELNSIIKNKFSNLYLLAHKVVKKANDDGIIVGSRGSVGSSFIAFLAGITDVNALPPHYVCPECKRSTFDVPAEYTVGADLPDKNCKDCAIRMNKDGYNIFFEVFLGFKGDKVPDIDLNFPGYYQSVIHKYVEELFGKESVFRAGTISTISHGIANIIINKFVEERQLNWSTAEKARMALGCSGVKKTTGQHPGGLIIVPKDKEIYEFCPIQYPSERTADEVITTHFDYHRMESQLVKLDMLGQDDPAQLLMLREYTGYDFNNIPYDDKETLELFSGVKSIGVKAETLGSKTATFAVPEFGTEFVRGMLEDTRPKNIGELVRISGLSHGTDVWQNNAQDLIKKGTAKLGDVISARDDIMLYLINKGMDAQKAFKIMENVRKGKGLTEEEVKLMTEVGAPKWYINSCQKIKYLFPKAHAVAYVVMAYKIAYYKVHFPAEFYASFFTIKANDLNLEHLLMDLKSLEKLHKERATQKYSLTQKEKVEFTILEVIKEAKLRNIVICNVDITQSLAFKTRVIDGEILPPLVSVDGLGVKVAEKIEEERNIREFRTIEDLCDRCKVNKKVLEALNKFNCLKDLPETDQYSLF